MNLIFKIILILLLSSFSFPQTAPPKPLHFVQDHWTPYDPPKEFPEGTEVYIIQPGDTLWDLAQKKLGNPYLWPQIWENNKYILDAHWIYPGDPLVFKKIELEKVEKGEVIEEEMAEEEIEELAEGEKEEEIKKEVPEVLARPVPIGDESDIYCFVKISSVNEDYKFKIIETDDPELRYTLSEGHIVYINAGLEEGIKAGDSFLIASSEPIIIMNGKEKLGKLWILNGKLTVLCAQEHSSTARIDYACKSIYRDYVLIPYEITPIPAKVLPPLETVCFEDLKNVHGKIVYTKDEIISIFAGHDVVIDLGSKDGVEPGSLLKIYRKMEGQDRRLIIGRVGILTVHDRLATAKVIEANRELNIGDEVELE